MPRNHAGNGRSFTTCLPADHEYMVPGVKACHPAFIVALYFRCVAAEDPVDLAL